MVSIKELSVSISQATVHKLICEHYKIDESTALMIKYHLPSQSPDEQIDTTGQEGLFQQLPDTLQLYREAIAAGISDHANTMLPCPTLVVELRVNRTLAVEVSDDELKQDEEDFEKILAEMACEEESE